MSKTDKINETGAAKKHPIKHPIFLAVCIVLFLACTSFGFYNLKNSEVAAVISLDVNPSVELKINRSERVLSCTALNGEAAQALFELDGGRDLVGSKLNLAVDAVIGAFVHSGYYDSVLVSVEDSDTERAARLREEIESTVENALKKENVSAEVISGGIIPPDGGLERLAESKGVSVGRAALINKIIELNGELSFDRLAELTAEELEDLLKAGAPAMPIGTEAAKAAALKYSGGDKLDVFARADSEIDDVPPHYEVEIYTSFGEFEYKVDPYTGDILSGQPDIAALYLEPSRSESTQPPVSEASETEAATASQTTQPAVTEAKPTTAAATAAAEAYIGEEAAKQAALLHAGVSESDVSYIDCHIDYEDGYPDCYDVEFVFGDTCYEYEIELCSGSIREYSHEAHHSGHEHHHGDTVTTAAAGGTDIGESKALSIALAHAGKAQSDVYALETERELERGILEYEIEFKSGGLEYKYVIDGYTGSILEYEVEND
ncbi:MAG: PepSY domain-containing protein [Bacteroides sp.]|nr:PepSY domain-containing protein [Bacteroides sp.]